VNHSGYKLFLLAYKNWVFVVKYSFFINKTYRAKKSAVVVRNAVEAETPCFHCHW